MDLLLAIFFASLVRMLIGVDKRAGFRHAIDDEEYEILKQLATGKFVKPVKERLRKEKVQLLNSGGLKGNTLTIFCLAIRWQAGMRGFIVEIYVKY